MSDEPVISVSSLDKAYRIWATPGQRLISPIWRQLAAWLPGAVGTLCARRARAGYRDFYALQGLTLEIARGEAVGIIGRNGAGKSTLLQIIAGTLRPTTGDLRVVGRVAALLELGAGFNPEFTGRENVYLNGAMLGLSRREIDDRFADIADFADIGDFIDQPVKTYSSGMMVRLAFAVQTIVDPDILIVDEALSVGDFFFAQKCLKRIREMRTRGTTILFVSHDMGTVRDLCEKCLYLRNGRVEFWGSQQDAIRLYFMEQSQPPASIRGATPATLQSFSNQTIDHFMRSVIWGPGIRPRANPTALRMRGLKLLDGEGLATTIFKMGSELRLELLVTADQGCEADVTCTVLDRYQQTVSCLGTYTSNTGALVLAAGETALVTFRIRLNFEAGLYSLSLSLSKPGLMANRGSGEVYDTTPMLGPIEIQWDYENDKAPFLGRFGPPTEITLAKLRH